MSVSQRHRQLTVASSLLMQAIFKQPEKQLRNLSFGASLIPQMRRPDAHWRAFLSLSFRQRDNEMGEGMDRNHETLKNRKT